MRHVLTDAMSANARRASLLCMALFAAQPIQFGVWLSRIAEVQTALDITKSELAFALLGMPIGLLPTLYFAGGIIDRVGPRKALIWAFPPMLFAGILPGISTGTGGLFAALFFLGVVFAFSEVGLNVFAAQTEKTFSIKIMNRAHGFWSLGVMIGSLLGVQLASLGASASTALIGSGIVLLPVLMFIATALPTYRPVKNAANTVVVDKKIPVGIIPIAIVVFGATITEGAMNDWATVYMNESPWGGTVRDGLAVTFFAGMVTLGRFMGDALNNRLGPVRLARLCLTTALAGVAVLVTANSMSIAFAGFALIGFGVSTIFPLGISAATALNTEREARNVSIMTFGALSGFLIGPPTIGLIAEFLTLSSALAILGPLLLLSLVFARRLLPA